MKVSRSAIVALIAALSIAGPGRAQTGSPSSGPEPTPSQPATAAAEPEPTPTPPDASPSFGKLVLTDFREVLGAPLSWKGRQWQWFAVALGGVGVLSLADDAVRDQQQTANNQWADSAADFFEPLGSYAAFGVLGSFWLGGHFGHDDRARWTAEDGLIASVLAAGIVTPALKTITGRVRPRDTDQTYVFDPFSGNASFPSGHATEAFAVASVIATEYHATWVKAISYGSASLVGFARIHHQAHFLSDVAAGAVIGTAIGREVVIVNRRRKGESFALAPLSGPHGEPGVAIDLRLR